MRTIVRALLVVLLLVAVGFLMLGLWAGSRVREARVEPRSSVGTSGSVDVSTARERGAELGEKAAAAAQKIEETASEAATTTKIKAKMALDDSVRSRSIDVSTNGSTVTLSGKVGSKAEHDRALALARDTSGVTRVIDHLEVRASK
jgi:osmotically-inducible protein OsmY